MYVVWKRADEPGIEYCEINVNPMTSLKGEVFSLVEKEPIYVEYNVMCDEQGCTHNVKVQCRFDKTEKYIELSRSSEGRWYNEGFELKQFFGFKDIDIGITPSTNSLPIRRFNLQLGETNQFSAVWLKFPDLVVQPLEQRYTRLGKNTYLYESVESGYTALLKVDEIDIVVSYESEWERV